jgi:hypothetical protein
MSVSSVNASSQATVAVNAFKQRRQDIKALGAALANNDLAAAQSAFADLQKLAQASAGTNGSATQGTTAVGATSSASATLTKDFDALAKALGSNDLSGAKAAFAQLQGDFRLGHHHRGGAASASTGAATQASTSTQSTGTDSDGDNDGSAQSAGSRLNVSA